MFNCRVMGEEGSTFEDIVDAYLAYLQVSFTKNTSLHLGSLGTLILSSSKIF